MRASRQNPCAHLHDNRFETLTDFSTEALGWVAIRGQIYEHTGYQSAVLLSQTVGAQKQKNKGTQVLQKKGSCSSECISQQQLPFKRVQAEGRTVSQFLGSQLNIKSKC